MNTASPSLKERLRALFALSGKTAEKKDDCPSVEDLAALIDGNLNIEKRDILMAHLDTCPECYHEWLTAASILAETDQSHTVEPNHQRGTGIFNTFRSRVSISFAVAASLALLVYFNIFRQPSLQKMINQQYQIAMETHKGDTAVKPSNEAPAKKGKTLDPHYGFTGSSQEGPSPFARNFLWGFQTGKTLLDTRNKSLDEMESENKTYFWAGRWLALLAYLCESHENRSEEFWETQHRTTVLLLDDFNQHMTEENDAVIIARSLQRIDTGMKNTAGDPCRVIESEITFILDGMNISE